MPARRPARPEPAAPHRLHARAADAAGAGVRQGELRVQAAALRAGHGAQLTRDNDKGTGTASWSMLPPHSELVEVARS